MISVTKRGCAGGGQKTKNHQPDNKTKLYLDVSQNMINDLLKPLESNQDTEQGGEGCCEGNMID